MNVLSMTTLSKGGEQKLQIPHKYICTYIVYLLACTWGKTATWDRCHKEQLPFSWVERKGRD